MTEPAGRYLQFYNTTTAWGDKVIDHVIASDGRTVQYSYVHNAVAGATTAYTRLDHPTYYGDSTLVAQYTYVKPNVNDPNGATYNGVPFALWYWRLDGGGPTKRQQQKEFPK